MIGGGFGGVGRVSANRPDPKLGVIVHRKVNMKRTLSPDQPDVFKPLPESGIGVRFVAPFFDGSGYAEGARQWLAAMVTAGVDVRAEPVSFEEARTDYGLAGEIAKKAVNRKIDCKISMVYLTPDMYPLHKKEGHYNIGLFEWETDKLPSKWVHECNAMDEIWVCSHLVANVARAGGVKKPIHVFGHCVNPAEYAGVRALKFPELPKNCFKFYSIFQWTERKNPKGLLQAYLTAFRRKDPVILILKTYRANYSIEEQQGILDEVENIKQEIGGNQPRILFIPEMLSRQEILSLHATGDCFVLPHRSEGWGLPHFDACAMGKPVVTTRFGGNLEFMNDDTAFLLDFELIPTKGRSCYTDDMSWAEPNIEECRKHIRYVYSHQGEARKRAAEARHYVLAGFTWEIVGKMIRERLSQTPFTDQPKSNIKTADPKRDQERRLDHKNGRHRPPEVLWAGHLYDYSGYGKANREIIFRIGNTFNIRLDTTHQEPRLVDENTCIRLDAFKGTLIGNRAPVLRFFGPDFFVPQGPHRILWTMMETYKIHPDMVKLINMGFDELWTPTEWNRRVFVESGVSIPSRSTPLGVNKLIYRINTRGSLPPCRLLSTEQAGTVTSPKGFIFLSVGLPSFRKGFDIIADALDRVFDRKRDIHFVIAVTHSNTDWNRKIYEQFANYRIPIWSLEGKFEEHEMARIYSSCDVYVSASRGEGWNLPVCEASACGLPVICPDNTSHPEVVGQDAFLFRSEGTDVCPECDIISEWYKGMPFATFGKKSKDELAEILKLVHAGGTNIREKAARLRERMLSKWTWDNAASLVSARLMEVQP